MISKDYFCKGLEKVREIWDLQESLYNIADNSNVSAMFSVEFPTMIDDYLEVLGLVMNDINHWIQYWAFELDFGRRYEDGMVLDYWDKPIVIKTSEDLYDFLVSNLSDEVFVNVND